MARKTFYITLFALIFAFVKPANAKLFDAKEKTLQNGMKIVVVENHKAPILTSMVWYKVGAKDDPAGRSGLAHFNEHLMFKGTRAVPEGEFSKIISRNGGNENALTSQDYTAYYQTIAKDKLELLMFLEADRMKNISFSDEAFEKEHKVIIEERLSRYENNPKALFSERLRRILWGVHPYGEPVIGYSDEIKAIEKKDVMTFYKNWYTPNNAILVVAGDVKPKKVFSLANKYFGKIPATKLPKRTDVNTSPEYINAKIKTKSELVKQPILKKIFVTPSIMIDNDRLAYPLEILNEILGSDMTSKLYQSLVIEQKKTVSISSWYNGKRLGNGTFSIYASPSNGVSLEELDKAIDLEINKIFEQKISKKEVEKAKKRLSYGLVYLKDEPSTAARILGSNLALGYPLEEIETWEEKINQVSTKDVNKAFDYLINKASNIVGYLSKD